MDDHTLITDLSSLEEARLAARGWIEGVSRSDPLLDRFVRHRALSLDVQLVPPTGGDRRDYLSLHFEGGHALFPNTASDMCLWVGLYRGPRSHESSARTRLVRISDVAWGRAWGTRTEVEESLSRYARTHGSSWDWARDSGNRTSCFARVIDALCPPSRLTNFRATARERWRAASHEGHEFARIADEEAFYASCGVELPAIERRVALEPGQLLLLDNVRCVHGRIGTRRAAELSQLLFSVRCAPREDLVAVRNWIVGALTRDTREEAAAGRGPAAGTNRADRDRGGDT